MVGNKVGFLQFLLNFKTRMRKQPEKEQREKKTECGKGG